MNFFAIAPISAEGSQSKLGARSWRLYPGGSAVVRRLQHSCFTDGVGVLQTGRDYYTNHDQIDISLKWRFLGLETLTGQSTHL